MPDRTTRLTTALQQSIDTLLPLIDEGAQGKLAVTEAVARWIGHENDSAFLCDHYGRGRGLLAAATDALTDAALAEAVTALPERLDARFRPAVLEADIARIASLLAQARDLVQQPGNGLSADWITDVFEWERSYYLHLSAPIPIARTEDGHLDAATFQTYLRRAVDGAEHISVVEAQPLSGGYGRATILLRTDAPLFGETELIVRAEMPVSILTLEGIDITTEFAIIKMAHDHGIAAPEPLLLEAGSNETGLRFILLRRVTGSSYGTAFSSTRAISDTLIGNLVAGLAAIHAIPLTEHPDVTARTHLRLWNGDRSTQAAVRRWVLMWRDYWQASGIASPVLADAFHWLLANIPASSEPPVLLHSDYALGNLLIEDDIITGVLDWEATHVGDPAEEVAWLAFNLRNDVGEAEVVRRYSTITGKQIPAERLRYFDVLTAVKMVACGFNAMAKFRSDPGTAPIFCLLASYTIEPYLKLIPDAIATADGARGRADAAPITRGG
ncbi:MAG: phosphotransferase family protein [Sphingobium sp.]